jgi:hypothetical protein
MTSNVQLWSGFRATYVKKLGGTLGARSFSAGDEAVLNQAAGPDRINVTANERRVRQGTR